MTKVKLASQFDVVLMSAKLGKTAIVTKAVSHR
jgi:hypothetical protein